VDAMIKSLALAKAQENKANALAVNTKLYYENSI